MNFALLQGYDCFMWIIIWSYFMVLVKYFRVFPFNLSKELQFNYG